MAHPTAHPSPVGPLSLSVSEHGLREVRFGLDPFPDPTEAPATQPREARAMAARATAALEAHFRGDADPFSALPLDLTGLTDFRRAVLELLRTIPRGSLITYGELARRLGRGSPRSVGQAVGANPLPIVVPCHRVVAAGRRLGGFSGGLERKVSLLALEGVRTTGPEFGARIVEG